MTPFASVAMLEKLALLKIALCNAPVLSRASLCRTSMLASAASAVLLSAVGIRSPVPEKAGSAVVSLQPTIQAPPRRVAARNPIGLFPLGHAGHTVLAVEHLTDFPSECCR